MIILDTQVFSQSCPNFFYYSERFYLCFTTLCKKSTLLQRREKAKTDSPVQSTNLSFTESITKKAVWYQTPASTDDPPNNTFTSKLRRSRLLFLTSTVLGTVAFKKLVVNFLFCLLLITVLNLHDPPNFQCGKASSSPNKYYGSILKLKIFPFAVFEWVFTKEVLNHNIFRP